MSNDAGATGEKPAHESLPLALPGLPSAEHLKKVEAETARKLAYTLVVMLGVSVVLQYGTLAFLIVHNHSDSIPIFEHLFNTWLPVIAGLTSAAVTYYLTREKRG
jgi:hypothetical protein